MNELRLLQDDNPFLRKQLRRILWATLLGLSGGVVNLVIFGSGGLIENGGLSVRTDVIARALSITFILYTYILLRNRSLSLVGYRFFWVISFAIVFITWLEGGLYSHIMLCLPIILVFSALYIDIKEFFGISIFLTIAVGLMGLNNIYNWYPAPVELFVAGAPRVISGLLIIIYTSYISWILGDVLKVIIVKLKEKNQRLSESQEVIRKLAEFDSLTGLLNREAARVVFEKVIQELSPKERAAFYFIDLDNFKNINDLFDHHEGDRLLIQIAERLKSVLGDDNMACRLGGDEFIVCLRGDQSFDFDAFAQKLVSIVSQPYVIFGAEVEVTASIGIAVIGQGDLSFDDVRKKADMAMYQAKQSGKNQYHYYSDELDKEYMRNLSIVTGLKDAVSNDLLDIHYQPKINLSTQQIEG